MRRSFLLLVCVWAGLLPFYAIWLSQDRVVAPWDMSGHARMAFDLWHSLARGHLFAIYTNSEYYPPLFHVVAAPLAIFSGNPDSFCIANWLFLLLTMWAVWLIGRQLWGETTGLVAAILVPACIYIAWMCLQAMTDLCLTACVCWTLWALIRTPNLEGRQAHLLGILIGLGMLAKWTYPFFAAAPISIYFAKAYRTAPKTSFFRSIFIVFVWVLVVAGPWYIRSLPHFVKSIGPQLSGEVAANEGDPAVMSIASLTRYWYYLGKFYFQIPLLCFIATGLLYLMIKRRADFVKNSNLLILFSSIVTGLLILTLIANKDPRYIMPVVPLILVVSAGMTNRKYAAAAAIALAFAMTGWNLFFLHAPLRKSTGVEEIAEWMIQKNGNKHVRAIVVPNEWTLNRTALDYALHRRDAKSGARRIGKNGSIPPGSYVITLNPPNENKGILPHEQERTRDITQDAEWKICKIFVRHDGKTIEIRKRLNHGGTETRR